MNSERRYPCGWVAPFGDPGITDRSHLPRAFRSVPRPSSPLSAKASTRCPYLALDHRRFRCGGTTGSARETPHTTAAHRAKTPALGAALLHLSLGATSLPRTQRPRMKTLLRTGLAQARLAPPDRRSSASPKGPDTGHRRRPSLSASVTSQLSLFTLQSTPASQSLRRCSLLRQNAHAPVVEVHRCNTVAPMVEVNGIEPMTSCLQSRRSPN